MHHNYFILRQLARFMQQRLEGMTLAACYSNTPDELYFEWTKPASGPFHMQLKSVNNQLLFTFPAEPVGKARLFMPQFKSLLQQKVTDVHVVAYDRVISIHFDHGAILAFKLFGRFSNVILLEDNHATDLFHKHLQSDMAWTSEMLKSRRAFDFDAPACSTPETFKKQYPFIPEDAMRWLYKAHFFTTEETVKPTVFASLKQLLEYPDIFYVVETEQDVTLTLFDTGIPGQTYTHIEEAVNAFTALYIRFHSFHNLQKQLADSYTAALKQKQQFVDITKRSLSEITNRLPYEHMANIIMANLHAIPEGAASATLLNFYADSMVTIKLDPDQSPQKQAEKYYRKAKNEHIEIQRIEARLHEAMTQCAALQAALDTIKNATSPRDIKEFVKKQPSKDKQPDQPFKIITVQGYQVMVGKHAKGNDVMLRDHAHKNDTWLHAKDVAGSHVLIKNPSGKPVPSSILERVASIAAYHSRARNQTVVPVIYTERKYVRKVKGAAPGQVVVDKETILLVKPETI